MSWTFLTFAGPKLCSSPVFLFIRETSAHAPIWLNNTLSLFLITYAWKSRIVPSILYIISPLYSEDDETVGVL